MGQQVVEVPVVEVDDMPLEGEPVNVLVRLWEEAQQAVKAPLQPAAAARRQTLTELERVRYSYD